MVDNIFRKCDDSIPFFDFFFEAYTCFGCNFLETNRKKKENKTWCTNIEWYNWDNLIWQQKNFNIKERRKTYSGVQCRRQKIDDKSMDYDEDTKAQVPTT